MPLFYYFPLIVWMGLFAMTQDQLRPGEIKVRR